MSEELKPCPFCGSTEVTIKTEYNSFVSCENDDCECDGPIIDTVDGAIAAWNTRSSGNSGALERAWREGWADCREYLFDDAVFAITDDVEQDAWLDSSTRKETRDDD